MQAKHYDTSYRDTGKRKNFLRKLKQFQRDIDQSIYIL